MFYAGTIFAVASNQAERAEKTIVADARYMEMLSPEVCTSFSLYAVNVTWLNIPIFLKCKPFFGDFRDIYQK